MICEIIVHLLVVIRRNLFCKQKDVPKQDYNKKGKIEIISHDN